MAVVSLFPKDSIRDNKLSILQAYGEAAGVLLDLPSIRPLSHGGRAAANLVCESLRFLGDVLTARLTQRETSPKLVEVDAIRELRANNRDISMTNLPFENRRAGSVPEYSRDQDALVTARLLQAAGKIADIAFDSSLGEDHFSIRRQSIMSVSERRLEPIVRAHPRLGIEAPGR